MCKKVWRTCLSEVESRTQDSRPRPRTQKNPRPRPRTAFPRTDTLEAKDRNARGQGQGPRTQAQVLSKKKKKKKGLHKNFSGDLHKETFSKKFFKRSRPRTSKSVLEDSTSAVYHLKYFSFLQENRFRGSIS